MSETRFLPFKGKVITITKGDDGLWRTADGTVWAFQELAAKNDPVDRCGVYPFALPTSNPLTPDCKVHDYMYSTPGFQAFHTRAEADIYLEHLIEKNQSGWSIMAKPFWFLARVFGGRCWENQKTND